MIDLHIHTTMSDGQLTPSEVVRLASSIGVSTMAIADHDTVDGVEEGSAMAQSMGIGFISGIEISVKGNEELHILGYCVDIQNGGLKKACEQFLFYRKERVQRIIDYLKEKRIEISAEQVLKNAVNGQVGRPHFARALLDSGHIQNIREAYDLYLATPEFNKIERPKPDFSEGISMIRNAGGVAVLAHPSKLKLDNDALVRLLNELVSAGLKGIEAYYSTHTKEQTDFYLSLAKEHDLIVTAGSDYHGEKASPEVMIGTGINNSLRYDNANIIRELLEVAKSD